LLVAHDVFRCFLDLSPGEEVFDFGVSPQCGELLILVFSEEEEISLRFAMLHDRSQ